MTDKTRRLLAHGVMAGASLGVAAFLIAIVFAVGLKVAVVGILLAALIIGMCFAVEWAQDVLR